MCAQTHALDTRTKFRLEILTVIVISGGVYFREIILESSRNVSETTPRILTPSLKPEFPERLSMIRFLAALTSVVIKVLTWQPIAIQTNWNTNKLTLHFHSSI